MSNLKAKLKKQGGFTLVEMLIVVAIIAILVAISIPLINSALERAKHATDAANERSAKAEILICWLSDAPIDGSTGTKVAPGTLYNYDAVTGQLTTGDPSTKDYGKHNGHTYLTVKVDTAGVVTVAWKDGKTLCSACDVGGHTDTP